MNDKTLLALVSMGLITFLEAIAIICGLDGVMLGATIGIIAGLGGLAGGYEIAKRRSDI